MYNKIIGIFICFLLTATFFIPNIEGLNIIQFSIKSENSKLLLDDELDQYNHNYSRAFVIHNGGEDDYAMLSQSFIPTFSTLTRLKLYLSEGFGMTCDLIVSIRSDINGSDLATASKNPEEIPDNPDWGWIEFDFDDINVEIGATYYIYSRCNCGSMYYPIYGWAVSFNDTYANGTLFDNYIWGNSTSNGWYDSFCDSGFETYGYGQDNNIIIREIKGGFGFNVIIKNNGTSTATDISWSIDVEGGLIFRGQSKSDIISELEADETYNIRHRVLGLGGVTITATAAGAVKQSTAFVLGSLVLRAEEM